MEDEIFGPILPILTYRTLDEAFQKISTAPRPLAAFIFSRNQGAILGNARVFLEADGVLIKCAWCQVVVNFRYGQSVGGEIEGFSSRVHCR